VECEQWRGNKSQRASLALLIPRHFQLIDANTNATAGPTSASLSHIAGHDLIARIWRGVPEAAALATSSNNLSKLLNRARPGTNVAPLFRRLFLSKESANGIHQGVCILPAGDLASQRRL